MKKIISYPPIEDILDLDPIEFGKALAHRHLKMVQDAVKEWATGYAETHCTHCGKRAAYCTCAEAVTRWADPDERADWVLETEDEDVSTED